MSTFGLIDPEFGPRGLIDPEFTNTGLIDAELSSSTTATLAAEDDGWLGSQVADVVRVAASIAAVLAVTTFGFADELPSGVSTPIPDEMYAVDLRVVPQRVLSQVWTVEDDLPTRIDEEYQYPLVSLRTQVQSSVLWVDDELPRVTTFEEDALPVLTVQRPAVQVTSWTDDDFVQQTTTIVDEDYQWDGRQARPTVTTSPIWVDGDEVPVLVPTDVDFTPLLDQKINRPANLTLFTESEEWPTPVPPSCVPTEGEWTPLLLDRLEKSRDLRVWDFADELPSANPPEEMDWAPFTWQAQKPIVFLTVEQDDLPTTVVVALQEQDWTPLLDQKIVRPINVLALDAQEDLPNSNVPDETFSTPLLDQKLEPTKYSRTWKHVDELPNPTPQEESDYTPLLGQRIDRPSFAKVFDVPDEHPIITVVVPTETEYTPLLWQRVERVSYARVWNADDDQPLLAVIAKQYTIIHGNASYAPRVDARASVTTQTITANASFVKIIEGEADMLGISNPIPPN